MDFITGLLELNTWEIIFNTFFYFGFIFLLITIIGTFLSQHSEVHSDADNIPETTPIDLDGDGVIDGYDLNGDGIIDINLHSFEFDVHDHLTFEHDIHHVEINKPDLSFPTFKEEKSRYIMGNIAIFSLFFGEVGSIFTSNNNLNDLTLLFVLVIGVISEKIFAWVIANYTKTVIVPVIQVQRGDIGTVIFGLDYEKISIVNVTRKDGVVTPIMAKGAFPHDYFLPQEKGYIIGKIGEFYLITKGLKEEPKLQNKEKKAMDEQF